ACPAPRGGGSVAGHAGGGLLPCYPAQEVLRQAVMICGRDRGEPEALPKRGPTAVAGRPKKNNWHNAVSTCSADDTSVLGRRDTAQVTDHQIGPPAQPRKLGGLVADKLGREEIPRRLHDVLDRPGHCFGLGTPPGRP